MIFDEKNPSLSFFPVFLIRKKTRENDNDGFFSPKIISLKNFFAKNGLA